MEKYPHRMLRLYAERRGAPQDFVDDAPHSRRTVMVWASMISSFLLDIVFIEGNINGLGYVIIINIIVVLTLKELSSTAEWCISKSIFPLISQKIELS